MGFLSPVVVIKLVLLAVRENVEEHQMDVLGDAGQLVRRVLPIAPVTSVAKAMAAPEVVVQVTVVPVGSVGMQHAKLRQDVRRMNGVGVQEELIDV